MVGLILPILKSHISLWIFSVSLTLIGSLLDIVSTCLRRGRRSKLIPGTIHGICLLFWILFGNKPELFLHLWVTVVTTGLMYHSLDYSQEFIKRNALLSKCSLRDSHLCVCLISHMTECPTKTGNANPAVVLLPCSLASIVTSLVLFHWIAAKSQDGAWIFLIEIPTALLIWHLSLLL